MNEANSEVILSPTGECRVVVTRRGDGNYEWRHETYLPPDPEYGWEEDWETVHPGVSGLYDSRERAFFDARRQVAWLGTSFGATGTVIRELPWWLNIWPSWLRKFWRT